MSVHLLRRGVEIAVSQFKEPSDDDRLKIEIKSWGTILVLALITLVLSLALICVDYTYGNVVTTLAAIEDSHPDVYVRIDNENDDDPNKSVDARESPVVENESKPITSKLRTTVKHLRNRAGPWSRFRGFSMFLVYSVSKVFLVSIVPVGKSHFFAQFFVTLLVDMLLANLQVAWVHIVISEPSPKRWYQRIPGRKAWRQFALAVALYNIVIRAAFYLPLSLIQFFGGWDSITRPDLSVPATHTIVKVLATLAGPSLLTVIVGVPARAVLIRVAASTLPEDHEAIVPFDRSFGGKVVPAILGGTGCVSITDAWKTFDWPARMRYFKAFGKAFAINLVLTVGIALACLGQIYVVQQDIASSIAPGDD